MALVVEKRDLTDEIKGKQKGDAMTVKAVWEDEAFLIPCEVMWVAKIDAGVRIGLRATDFDPMYNLVASVTGEELPYPVKKGIKNILLEHEIRTTALILWVIFIGLSFGIPAYA